MEHLLSEGLHGRVQDFFKSHQADFATALSRSFGLMKLAELADSAAIVPVPPLHNSRGPAVDHVRISVEERPYRGWSR
jgi:hypothetical protein